MGACEGALRAGVGSAASALLHFAYRYVGGGGEKNGALVYAVHGDVLRVEFPVNERGVFERVV